MGGLRSRLNRVHHAYLRRRPAAPPAVELCWPCEEHPDCGVGAEGHHIPCAERERDGALVIRLRWPEERNGNEPDER